MLIHNNKIRRGEDIIFQPYVQVGEIQLTYSPEGKPVKLFNSLIVDGESKKKFPTAIGRDLDIFGSHQWVSMLLEIQQKAENLKMQNPVQYISELIAKKTKLTVDRLTENPKTKWYHKVVLDNNKTRSEKIHFVRNYKSLNFALVKTTDGFGVEYTLCTEDEELIPQVEMQHFYGFLRRENVYYVLKIKDMDAIFLLGSLNSDQHKNDLQAFLKYVLAPIEKTHKVQRVELIDVEIEEIRPRKQLYLSELAGSFLVITPKFDYGLAVFEDAYQEFQEIFIKEKYYKIKRHKQDEENFRSYIKSLHPRFANQFMGNHNLNFDEAKKDLWFFKVYREWLDEGIYIIGMDLMKNFRYSPYPIETNLTQKGQSGNLITFECKVNFDKEFVKLSDLKKILLAGGKSIYLKDNSIGVLSEDWIEAYSLIFKHGKISNNTIIVPKWIALIEEQEAVQKSFKFNFPEHWLTRWKQWQNSDEPLFEIPKPIHAQLREYQRKGFEWMVLLDEINAGCCLADDMGLGKTLQTIAFLAHLAEKDETPKFLVICPASLLYNWKKEIEKFAPSFRTHIYHGLNRNFVEYASGDEEILICSYSTARNDIDKLKSLVWDAMVLDESHNIRSLRAQTTQAIHQINAKSNVILSGTPLINNTFDMFAQFEVILPGFLGGQEFFNSSYATPIDKFHNASAIKNLNKLTRPFILRRTKQQVAKDLPDKMVSVLYCEMNYDQRETYQALEQGLSNSLFQGIENSGLEKNRLNVLQAINKLRQICSHPILLNPGSNNSTSSIKLTVVIEEIERNLANHKVLVFSQYLGMLDEISLGLKNRNIAHFRFDGGTHIKNRIEMVTAFQQEDSAERVFLISLKSGNTGITLTEADYVFIVDPWWNQATELQAIDRTHRIGQKNTVFAYKMICRNTIEERMLHLQQRKQQIAEELIIEDENIVKNLTLEDLEFLFDRAF